MITHTPPKRIHTDDIANLQDVAQDIVAQLHNTDTTNLFNLTESINRRRPIIAWLDGNGNYHEHRAKVHIKTIPRSNHMLISGIQWIIDTYDGPTSIWYDVNTNDQTVSHNPTGYREHDIVIAYFDDGPFDHITLKTGATITYQWLCPASVLDIESPVNKHFIDVKTMNNTELTINIDTIASIIDEG